MKKIAWLFFFLPGILTADTVYKWLDNNGVIQYSSEPPAITGPDDMMMDAGEIVFYKPKISSENNNSAYIARGVDKPEASVYCHNMRQNLTILYKHDRVRIRQPNGLYHELDKDQKQAKMDEIRAFLKQYCP